MSRVCRITICSPMTAANSHAMLWPIRENRRRLMEQGYQFTFTAKHKAILSGGNILLFDSKWQRNNNQESVLQLLDQSRNNFDKIIWLDTTDGTGTTQFEVMPYINAYFKSQLLKDRKRYTTPMYGNRLFAEFYHHECGIVDEEQPSAQCCLNLDDLGKLKLCWNSSLGDWGLWSGLTRLMQSRLGVCLGRSARFYSAGQVRSLPVACRMGRKYGKRASVSYQRRMIAERLEQDFGLSVDPVARSQYLAEMKQARVGVSPFGWGEIAYRDYELFLAGAAVFKADMSHMDTWPDLYQPDITYIPFRWDLSDFTERLQHVLDSDLPEKIAVTGQELYKHHLLEKDGKYEFCNYFNSLLQEFL